ncbi:hypothetical protein [Amycolatopsis sp. lyj-23]|uniref:hypothetical protein n=1 Tax=Amycolatopsis sp. lyj-23 TaxID=2789283 RepID=UPI003979575B
MASGSATQADDDDLRAVPETHHVAQRLFHWWRHLDDAGGLADQALDVAEPASTHAMVAVEAGQRSSTRHAARLTDKLGRPVPGPLFSGASAGCHQLIQDGMARLVTFVDDVLAVIEKSAEEMDPGLEAATPVDETDRR